MIHSKNIIFIKKNNNPLKIKVRIIPDWEGFDKLVQFLKDNYYVKVLKSADGPDARRWIFECEGKIFELIHDDDLGNYFLSPTQDSDDLVYRIGKDLEGKIK
jgi:hypothetical protein